MQIRDLVDFSGRSGSRIEPIVALLDWCTGAVEAGGKVVIGTRLKRTGMHGTVRGANVIMALRLR